MAKKRKTWNEKLHNGMVHSVELTKKRFADIPEGVTMLVATPEIVDEYIKNIPSGIVTNLQQMRKDLAAQYGAQYCCPVTAGIFLRISGEAAYEEFLAGKPVEEITPFWRLIDHNSPAIKKLSCGTDFIREQRKKEGLKW